MTVFLFIYDNVGPARVQTAVGTVDKKKNTPNSGHAYFINLQGTS